MVTHDAPAKMKPFVDARNIGYTMLSDPKAKIVPAFGVENPQFEKGSAWYGVAQTIIFVVNADGVVTHRFSRTDHRIKPDIDAILKTLKQAASG